MIKNLYSLGLLRNGKVYSNKELAYQGLTQSATNDGVAKLARYLVPVVGGDPIIRTLVGFYANAAEMEDAGGGQSYYTILDIEGSAADVEQIKEDIAKINELIGDGIDGTTLTDAINEINDNIGTGFTEDFTVADALVALEEELTEKLTISLDVAGESASGIAKTYILSQGTGTGKTEIGRIEIPKDIVVKEGKLVHGYWSGDTFTEDEEGPDLAIKLVLNNDDVIYINAKDLVDTYTAGDGISLEDNVVSINYNTHSEEFLVVDEDGIRVEGIQAAIDKKADEERLEASDGISIASNKVKAVAAGYSAPAIKNPITVDKDGIKFANVLDCGFFDDETEIVSTAEEINDIADPQNTDVFINGDGALNALTTKKTFKNIEVNDVDASQQIYLYANESINVDGMEITGEKGSTNGYVNYSAPKINITNLSIANGSTAYNIFEGDQTNQNLDALNASYIIVDNPSLAHNVFNVYKPKNDAVINISDSKFNLTVDNSNILRVSNYANATNVTVNFENIDWTYENGLTKNGWHWAGLVIYQPAGGDAGLSGNLDAMKTWTFNFKNCKYNGVKVTANNFGEHNQVFYMYNVGNDHSIKDAVAEGLTVNFI
jgi:hypothetical protein